MKRLKERITPPLWNTLWRTGALLLLLALLVFPLYRMLNLRSYFLWNTFLGVLPLGFSLLALDSYDKKRPFLLTLLFFGSWLFFFPNAPYMITDLIHLNQNTYYSQQGLYTNLQPWVALVHLFLGIVACLIIGYSSLYLLQSAVVQRWSSAVGWGFVSVVSLLTGIAIYIGRFLRFNSWDVLFRPHRLLLLLWENLSVNTVLFFLLFALMTFGSYWMFYAVFHPKACEKSIEKEQKKQ